MSTINAPASSVTSAHEMGMLLRTQMLAPLLGKEVDFDRRRLLRLLGMIAVLSLYEQLCEPLLRQLPGVPGRVLRLLLRGVRRAWQVCRTRRTGAAPLQERRARISYITESQHINELFDSVEWYINELLRDAPTEPRALVVFSRVGSSSNVAGGLPEGQSVDVSFQRWKIHVQLSAIVIDINADRTYKRKNRVLDLTVQVTPDETIDVLARFVHEAETQHRKHVANRGSERVVYRNTPKGEWERTMAKIRRVPDSVVLSPGMADEIFDDLDAFVRDEEWYSSHEVPYTRRFLFYGPPGTGKTSMIKAIATKYGRGLHFLLLSEVRSDTELFTLLESIDFRRTVLVIEDIDAASDVVQPREQQRHAETSDDNEPVQRLTLAGLLNAFDGAMLNKDGQIAVFTTNHPERLDPALIRAGRVDRKFCFALCDRTQARSLFVNFFGEECVGPAPLPHNWPVTGPKCPADVTGTLIQHRMNPEEAWRQLMSM